MAQGTSRKRATLVDGLGQPLATPGGVLRVEDGQAGKLLALIWQQLRQMPGYPLTPQSLQLDALAGALSLSAQSTSWPGGRLTLTTGVPITTADVGNTSTIYYTPAIHDRIWLWDGSNWVRTTFKEKAISLSSLTSTIGYDIFGYLSGGGLAVEYTPWTSNIARAAAVSLQDGRWCKSVDKSRLLLGSFLSVSTSQTQDTTARRLLANVYNRVLKPVESTDSATRTTTSTTFVSVGSVAIQWMVSIADHIVDMKGQTGATSSNGVVLGISTDATTLVSGCTTGIFIGAGEASIVTTVTEAPAIGDTSRYLVFRAPSGTATCDGAGFASGDRPLTCIRAMVEV